MLAWIRFTLVDLNLTVLTRISCTAFAFVRVLAVVTMTSHTRVAVAFVDVDLTRWACYGWVGKMEIERYYMSLLL